MTNKPVPDQSPGTPTRMAKKASGGGSKKLQQLLGASESDIDLLLRPAEILSTQTHRVSAIVVSGGVGLIRCGVGTEQSL